MVVHYLFLTFICFTAILIYRRRSGFVAYEYNLQKKNKQYLIITGFVLFLIISLRSVYVGLDTRMYYLYYSLTKIRPEFGRDRWEPFYYLITQIGDKANSFQLILVICAAVTCIGIGIFCYKNLENKASAFWFVFFFTTLNLYFNSMHLMRQMCAIAVTVNIYTVLRKDTTRKGYIKAIILLLIGMGFHITSVFAAVYFLPFAYKNITRKSIRNIAIISMVGIVLLSVGQRILLRLVPRFSRYMGDDRLTTGRIGVYAAVLILIKILMILYTLVWNPNKEENKEVYRLAYIIVVSTAFFMMQSRTQFALRIGYYYEIFMPLYIPVFINQFKKTKNRQILHIAMFLFGVAYFVYMIHFGGVKSNRGCVPYTFFWQV